MCYAEKLNVHDKQQSHPFLFQTNFGKIGERMAGGTASQDTSRTPQILLRTRCGPRTIIWEPLCSSTKKSNIGRPRGDSSCGASPLFIDRLKSRCVHKTCHPHTNPPSPVHRRSTLCSRSSDYIAAVFSLSWKLSSSLPLSLLRAFFLLQKGRKHYCFLLIAQMHWSC